MGTSDLILALDGLEEGRRYLVSELNSVLEIQCKTLSFEVKKKDGDNLLSARSRMRASLPRIMMIDPTRFAEWQPWTLGYVNGLTNHPANISLVSSHGDEVSGTIDFLKKQSDWTEKQWRKWILEPVEQHHLAWKSMLLEAIPKVKYSAGEDGFRRDEKIAELADRGWTNEEIAKEIERLSPQEEWDSIQMGHIKKRLTEYYAFIGKTKPIRMGGRPKKTY